MSIDRSVQLNILKELEKHFPDGFSIARLMAAIPNVEKDHLFRNLMYLAGHGLVKESVQTKQGYDSGDIIKFLTYAITSAGLDFLADDGGVSAILNTVTVKIHDETIRAMLLVRVDRDVPEGPSKNALLRAVETVSVASLKEIGTEAVKHGIANIPDIAAFLAKHAINHF